MLFSLASSKSTLSLWIKLIPSLATGDIIMAISRQDKIHYKISFLMHIRKTNKTRLIHVVVVVFYTKFCVREFGC